MRLQLLKLAVSFGALIASLLLVALKGAVLVARMVSYGALLGIAYTILRFAVFHGLPSLY